MRNVTTGLLAVAMLAAMSGAPVGPVGGVQAQSASPQPTPTPGDPVQTIPEKTAPQVPPAGSLSDRLEQTDGVIRPPDGIDPGISVAPPATGPDNMPAITPPGSPQSPSQIRPK